MENGLSHLLFEHASGYELFELRAFETLADVSYFEYSALTQTVRHVSSLSFKTAEELTARIQQTQAECAELPAELTNFLFLNNVTILYADKCLKKAVTALGMEHRTSAEIMRGIRANIHKFTGQSLNAQFILSAAHGLSRIAIHYDMGREDNIIVSVGHECEELERELTVLTNRLDSLLEWTMPNSKKLMKGGDRYLAISAVIKEELKKIEEGTEPAEVGLVEELSMPTRISVVDLKNLDNLTDTVLEKQRLLSELRVYLGEKTDALSPNLKQILGDDLCYKLIQKAGGLANLAVLPSSTLQLLGAEKSLFRSLKMRGKTPKYGLIYNLECLRGSRGRMCRFIASKCSLAARIDAFDSELTAEYGKHFRKLIEKKIGGGKRLETSKDIMERVSEIIKKRNEGDNVAVKGKSSLESKKSNNVDKKGSNNLLANQNKPVSSATTETGKPKKKWGITDLNESAKLRARSKESYSGRKSIEQTKRRKY